MSKNIDLTPKQSIISQMPYSPLKDAKSPEIGLTPKQIAKYYSFNSYQYRPLIHILQKQHSWRTHKQLQQISDYIKKNNALVQLAQINGMQFCKGIMRSATIQQYNRGQLIQQKGSPLTKIYIVLSGKLASIKNQDETDIIEQLAQKQVYQRLVNIARKEAKKVGKILRKFSVLGNINNFSNVDYKNYNQEQLFQIYQKDQIYGDKLLCFSKNITHTIITLQNSLLLTVDIHNLFHWLNVSFQSKLQQTYHLLKQHPCFSFLQSENLNKIIQILTINKIKRNEIVYQQGSEPNHIYFLQTGELTIEKETSLFIDNPNTLYMDRRKLMSQRELKNKQYLPYANLTTLYNLTPMNKTIQIGTINPFCIFGEQEMIESKARDTTVRCKSLNATYYGVQLKKIAQILKDDMMTFIEVIRQSLRQKVKYRQNIYANTINIENKNNLQGFYCDSPMNLNKSRRNARNKYKERLSSNQKFNQNNNPNKAILQSTQLIVLDNIKKQKQQKSFSFLQLRYNQQQQINNNQIPPLYNNFNFHKTINQEKIIQNQSFSLTPIPKGSIRKTISQQQKEQFRIIQNSHTWRLVKRKVDKQQKICTHFGTLKYKIDLNTPLIDGKYFQNIESKMKKLQRQNKKGKFSVSSQKINTKSMSNNRINKTRS